MMPLVFRSNLDEELVVNPSYPTLIGQSIVSFFPFLKTEVGKDQPEMVVLTKPLIRMCKLREPKVCLDGRKGTLTMNRDVLGQ